MRYFLRLAYDGTPFHGWQRQPNASSVQQTIEEAMSMMFRKNIEIVGAGRTDAGVHASEMFAHFDIDKEIDAPRFLTSINRMIGHSISIDKLIRVTPEAHARFDAIGRSYEYRITLRKDPFAYDYTHRMERLPDYEKMNQASGILIDTQDFTSFAKLHSDSKTNLCDVREAYWTFDEKKFVLKFHITADRFLRNMVRSLVGTLIKVGTGKLTLDGFKEIIEKKDRCEAGVSMPAKGLFLTSVEYPEEIFCHEY